MTGTKRAVQVLRWGAAGHRLRQHQAGGGADPRGRHAPADAGLQRAPVALLIRTIVSDARARVTTKEGGRLVGYARRNFFVPIPPVRQLGRVERLPRAPVQRASRAPAAAAHGDDRGALRARPRRLVAIAAGPVRRLRHADDAGHVVVAGALSPQRLLGADRLRPPGGAGERLRGRGRDRVRQ